MNDTNGGKGLITSLVVFGIIPRFAFISSDTHSQKERMLALSKEQMEMNSAISERRILDAVTGSIPTATDFIFGIGQEVLYAKIGVGDRLNLPPSQIYGTK